MSDFTIDFDHPQNSSQRSVHVLGSIPRNSSAGYIRIRVNVTNATRNDYYYRTIPVRDNTGQATFSIDSTYNVTICPKDISGDTVTATYAFSFTAQR